MGNCISTSTGASLASQDHSAVLNRGAERQMREASRTLPTIYYTHTSLTCVLLRVPQAKKELTNTVKVRTTHAEAEAQPRHPRPSILTG